MLIPLLLSLSAQGLLPAADPEPPAALSLQDARPRRESPAFGFTAGLHGRFSMPFGSADREISGYAGGGGSTIVIDSNLSWADLFDPGWGVEVEVDFYLGRDQHGGFGRGDEMRYGFFVSLATDTYGGDSADDAYGNRVKVDDLTMTTLLVGGKVEGTSGPSVFFDGRAGLGAVHTNQVMGDFSGPLVPEFTTEFLEEGYTFVFEFRGHGGVELGPINLVAGLGFRFMVPPSEGDTIDLDGGLLMTFDIEVGVEIGF